jgi:hypothetical protein
LHEPELREVEQQQCGDERKREAHRAALQELRTARARQPHRREESCDDEEARHAEVVHDPHDEREYGRFVRIGDEPEQVRHIRICRMQYDSKGHQDAPHGIHLVQVRCGTGSFHVDALCMSSRTPVTSTS